MAAPERSSAAVQNRRSPDRSVAPEFVSERLAVRERPFAIRSTGGALGVDDRGETRDADGQALRDLDIGRVLIPGIEAVPRIGLVGGLGVGVGGEPNKATSVRVGGPALDDPGDDTPELRAGVLDDAPDEVEVHVGIGVDQRRFANE